MGNIGYNLSIRSYVKNIGMIVNVFTRLRPSIS